MSVPSGVWLLEDVGAMSGWCCSSLSWNKEGSFCRWPLTLFLPSSKLWRTFSPSSKESLFTLMWSRWFLIHTLLLATRSFSFYSKCGMMDSALGLFDGMMNRDSVSSNAIIHWFLSREDYTFGLGLFMETRSSNFVPNISTLILDGGSWRALAKVETYMALGSQRLPQYRALCW